MSSSAIPVRNTQFNANSLIEHMTPMMDSPRTVSCPDSRIYNTTETLVIPDPSVVVDTTNLQVHIELEQLNEGSSATSIASDIFKRTFEDMRKFAHDFTFALFADKTDVRLSSIFAIQGDEHDRATPDMLLKVLGRVYAVEFATIRNTNSIQKSFNAKKFTYEGPLRTRIMSDDRDLTCFYGIVVVSADRVCTNIHLPVNLVNELCARYRCALSILTKVESQGISFKEDDTLSQLRSSIRTQLSSLEYKITVNNDGRTFTQDILNPTDSEITVKQLTTHYYASALLDANEKIKSERGFLQEHYKISDCEVVDNFVKEYDMRNPRTDFKSVVKFPLVIPCSMGELPGISKEDHPYADLWNDVIFKYSMGEQFLQEDQIEKIEEIALSDFDHEEEDKLKETRKIYHRVKLNLNPKVMIEFQKVGVEAKRVIKNPEVEMYREEKRKGISLSIDTSDISDFINNFGCISGNFKTNSQMSINAALFESLGIYGDIPKAGIKAMDWISGTDMFRYCSMISDIGVELAVSLKQHCHTGEFVLKKLKNFDLYLLIKPTNTESHIFVSMMFGPETIDLEQDGHCFKTLFKFSNYSCTEFISFDESKITNLVKTAPFYIAQIAQWCRYYECFYDSKESVSKDAWSMVKLCLLIHLDDKHYTEEVISLLRYVCMEKFSSLKTISNLKMLEKIPEVCRSRLQSWATKIILDEMLTKKYVLTSVDSEDLARAKVPTWIGMRNPFLNHPISKPQQLIELFYIGYAKNKDERSNPNQDFGLMNKILKYEDKLKDTVPELFGSKDIRPNSTFRVSLPESVKEEDLLQRSGDSLFNLEFHEWSKSAVIHAADTLKEHLRTTIGSSWQITIEQDILSRLSMITWEEMATLKASSLFNPSERLDIEQGRVHTKREKVIMRILQEIDSLGQTPMTSLMISLEKLEAIGGLIVDIFKKPQHGGKREIYVLDLYSRIIQRALEEIAKAYCHYLPSEVMVHPENKIRRPQHHLINVAKSKAKFKKNISSSNDAKVWNQGHHVLKFTQFMCRLLPEWLKPFYQRSMQLWMTRKIKLPDGIINLLREHPDIEMYDEVNEQVVQAYTGRITVPWMKKSSHYVTIESGMMQGILHYTSSLFHASVLLCRDELFKRMAKRRGFVAYTCDMVSSDDSSRITDITAETPKALRLAELYAMWDHCCIGEFSKLFGIRLSTKSTLACNWVVEFNSEWLFRVNLIRPVSKWSFACLGMTEDESIYERQEVWNTQLTELLEAGSGFVQAHLTQFAQGQMHYQMLGSAVNPLFNQHVSQIIDIPDPSLGFFLMDHPLATGLFGLSFAHWVAMTSCPDINKRAAFFLRSGEMTTTSKGIVTRGCVIRYGERKRAQRLLDECERSHPGWRGSIEEDPSIIYSVARDKPNSILKIMMKLASPSVMTSLSKNSALTRIIASSVYIINRHAITLSSAWIVAIHGEDHYARIRKTTLYREANRVFDHSEFLTDEETALLFPAISEYGLLIEKLQLCSNAKLVAGGSIKSLRSHVQVITGGATLPYSLEQMVRWKWFGENLPSSRRILLEIWNRYCSSLRWLRDDPKETLNASKAFESQIQLRNFIARQGPRTRIVHLTGSPVRDNNHIDMVVSAIVKNQFPGHVLSLSHDRQNEAVSSMADSIAHSLVCLQNFPISIHRKEQQAAKVMRAHPSMWTENMKLMDSRQTRLAILQKYIQMEKTKESVFELFSIINDSRLGIVGGFKDRQRLDESGNWSGKGTWIGKIGDVPVNLSIEDSTLETIAVANIAQLRSVQTILSKFCSDAKLKPREHREFTAEYSFDGRTIAPGISGTTVKIVDEVLEINPSNVKLEFKFYNNSFRIVSIDQPRRKGEAPGRPITLVSYLPKSWDFQPLKKKSFERESLLYQSWSTNEPLRKNLALDILESNVEKVKHPLDPDSFKSFVEITLQSSLIAEGWSFAVGAELAQHYTMDELASAKALMDDYDLDMFDNLDFEDEETELFNTFTEEDNPEDFGIIEALASDWQDLELGLMELVQNQATSIDIRRGHKIWKDLLAHWTGHISTKDRQLLCRKKYTRRTRQMADIFSHYFNWDMEEYTQDEPRLESVAEEDGSQLYPSEEEEDSPVSIDVGGDEWWDA